MQKSLLVNLVDHQRYWGLKLSQSHERQKSSSLPYCSSLRFIIKITILLPPHTQGNLGSPVVLLMCHFLLQHKETTRCQEHCVSGLFVEPNLSFPGPPLPGPVTKVSGPEACSPALTARGHSMSSKAMPRGISSSAPRLSEPTQQDKLNEVLRI